MTVTNKPKRHYRREETILQKAVVKYFHLQYPNEMIINIRNEGKRSKRECGELKAMGMVAGMPDLFIPSPAHLLNGRAWHIAHGLFIELKTPKGKISPAQQVVHERLRTSGYQVEVCRTLEEAITVINNYLK